MGRGPARGVFRGASMGKAGCRDDLGLDILIMMSVHVIWTSGFAVQIVTLNFCGAIVKFRFIGLGDRVRIKPDTVGPS